MSAVSAVYRALGEASYEALRDGVWVMGRVFYGRMRAEVVSEDQEVARALAHSRPLVRVGAEPAECPACGAAVDGFAGLSFHVVRFADPGFREPSPGDRLLGLPLLVEPGDAGPVLVAR